ncbi:MAG: hypothetical protein J6031_05445 [Bacteroidales bacterium]|nr:hypothetical protein [Bacteroidales bacterium]
MRKILKLLLIILNALIAVLMLASTLAGVIPPSRTTLFSLLSYGYLYFLIANIFFVIVWLLLSSKWFLLSVATVAIRYAFIPLYFQIGGSDTLKEDINRDEVLKILTFNAHHFHGVELNSETGDSNMAFFLKTIDEEQPDAMALQEYIGQSHSVGLTEQLRQRGYIYMTSGYDNGSITGEVIISKLPILRVVRIEGPAKLYTELLWGSDTVRLYCLHLNSYGLDESDHQQIHDISHGNMDSLTGRSTLHKFRETILEHEREWNLLKPYFENHNHLSVLAADLNDPPASYFYQQCARFMKDSYCEAGQGFSTTYHGSFTKREKAIFPAFRIDMILHTNDLEALTYKRIKSEMSDHYPVVVSLKKKPNNDATPRK